MPAPAMSPARGRGKLARHILMLVLLVGALGSLTAANASDPTSEETAVRDVLVAYHVALTSGDIREVEPFVVTDQRFTMVEGKHTNLGWADYRDNHLTPELAGLQKVDLTLDIREILVDGDLAFASFTYDITPKGDPEKNYGSARATAILVRENGAWLIRLMHTS
ncbi:MAG: nuclear transport factor 2 family protein [Proteobacteria bacterium]|nr:nuclear transport factor 2 family protein [Pseudomonadota bacterium]